MNLGIDSSCSGSQQHVQPQSKDTCYGHDDKDKAVTMSPNAGVASSVIGSGFGIVQITSKQAGEQEGSQRKVENEDVVYKTIIFEPKKF